MEKTTSVVPTIFHITHPKAGSQWVREILKYSAPDRFIAQEERYGQIYQRPIQIGGIYASAYLPYSWYQYALYPLGKFAPSRLKTRLSLRARLNNTLNFQLRKNPVISFLVIRDLRDTLVSLYFSLKVSHTIISEHYAKIRSELNELNLEDGMIKVMKINMNPSYRVQSSWMDHASMIIRFEDLIQDEHATFNKIIDYCQIDVDRQRLQYIIDNNSFERVTGRKPGEEDVNAHLRKGIAGDWRNYFTDQMKVIFKKKFGETLIKTGYETDLNW